MRDFRVILNHDPSCEHDWEGWPKPQPRAPCRRGCGAILLYQPQPKQNVLHNSTAPNILYGGAAGGAKSHGLRWHLFLKCLQYSNLQCLLLRRQFVELQKTHLLRTKLEMPREVARLREGHILTFNRTDSQVWFGHCKNPSDFEQYLSTEWDVIAIDQAETFTEEQLVLLQTRARSTRPDFVPQYVLSANPGGISHVYLKRRYIDKQVPKAELGEAELAYDPRDYEFIPSFITDNRYIDEAYIVRLEALPETLREAYLHGNWDVFAGQFFRTWDREHHVVDPFDVEDFWQIEAGMDWGYYPHPGVVEAAAFDAYGRAWFHRELVFQELSARAAAEQIYETFTLPRERQMLIRGDTEMWVKNPDTGVSIAEDINDRLAELESGISLIQANKDRKNGWARVFQYLDPEREHGPFLRVMRYSEELGLGCPYLIETLPAMTHDPKKAGDCLKTEHDHAPDACRYLMISRPPLTTVPKSRRKRPPYHKRIHARTRKILREIRRQRRHDVNPEEVIH